MGLVFLLVGNSVSGWAYTADVAGFFVLLGSTLLTLLSRKQTARRFPPGLYLQAAWAGWIIGVSGGCRVALLGLLIFAGFSLLINCIIQTTSWRQAALAGYVCGLYCFVVSINWVPGALAYFFAGHAVTGLLLGLPIVLVMALKFAGFGLAIYAARRWKLEWAGLTAAAAFWVLEQTFSGIIPTPVAVCLFPFKPLIQTADLIGLGGTSFLIVWLCYLAAKTWQIARNRSICARRVKLLYPCLTASLIVIWCAYGFWRIAFIESKLHGAPAFTVGIAQANTAASSASFSRPQGLELARNIVQLAAKLAAATPKPQLLVYGESTAPVGLESGHFQLFRDAYTVATRESGIPVLVDNIGVHETTATTTYTRESVLLESTGAIAGIHTKRQLVPIGETLPGESLWPGLRKLIAHGRSFVPGNEPTVLDVRGVRIAPLICLEILNPALVRQSANRNAQVLISPANDAWLNSEKEARQHYWAGAMRAVENRLPLIRAANTGISAAVDPIGNILIESPRNVKWTATASVPLANIASPYRHALLPCR